VYVEEADPQGTRAIEILFERQGGMTCSDQQSYYNTIDTQKSFYSANPDVSFSEKGQEPLMFLEETTSGQIKLTIPKDEQQFFAAKKEVRIKLSLKYTNQEYEEFVDSGDSTFQDIFITLYFDSAAQTVIPMLESDTELALFGDTVTISAWDTYVENVDEGEE